MGMTKYEITYLDILGNIKYKRVTASCEEMARVVFSNKNPNQIISVEEV